MGFPKAMSPDLEQLLDGSAWVKNLARSLVADPHSADDLVQEAWVVALQRAPEGADSSGLRRWLAAVMRNLARAGKRTDGRRVDREREVAGEGHGDDDAAAMLERLDVHQRVVEAVRGLDEPYRTAILLRYFEGASPTEIARRQGVPLRTVHSHLHRALSKLRARLRGEFGGDRGTWLLALLPLSRQGTGLGSGVLTGALIMDTKLKLSLAGATLVGVAAIATLTTDGAAPPEAVVSAALPAAETVLEPPRKELPVALESEGERAPAVVASTSPDHVEQTEPAPAALEIQEVAGRVLDVLGAPLADVRVGIRSFADSSSARVDASTRTGADGRFSLSRELEEGSRTAGELVLLDERYTTVLQPTTHFRPLSGAELVLVAAPRRSLAGIVVDPDKNPLAGARVSIDLDHDFHARFGAVLENSRIVRWNATTRPDGRFELSEAPAMEHCVLVTSCAGFARDVRPLPQDSVTEVEIVLGVPEEGYKLLEGTVVDLQGSPVEDARVALEFTSGTTDAAGHFSMRIEQDGERGVLMAVKRGMLPARIERKGDSNVAPDAWPEPLVLTLGGAPLAIHGRVVDADGEPLPEVKVWTSDTTHFGAVEAPDFGPMMTVATSVETLLRAPDAERKITTDANGRFVLDGLLDKDYRVSIHDPQRLAFERSEPVAAGTRDLVVVMPREERIPRVAGRVVGLNGDPIAGASVSMCRMLDPENGYMDDIASSAVRTDGEGHFEFRDMPISITHARVQGEGLDFLGNHFPIADGADLENLEVAIARRCRVRVELGDPTAGDGFQLLDADETILDMTVFRGNVAWSTAEGRLVDGRSEPVNASEYVTTLVLFKEHREVKRIPVRLNPDELNVLRL